MAKVSLFLLVAFVSSCLSDLPPNGECVKGLYPPPKSAQVPNYVINLDLPPEERWTKLTSEKKTEIYKIHELLKNLTGVLFHGKILELIDMAMPGLLHSLPSPYKEEITGIANATGMPLGEVILYNVFYEFFTVCTSVIAENSQGELFHARNLDFGLFLGWDTQNETWSMTEALRPTVVNLDFQRNGTTLYKATSFAGYVGILTAVKPGKFTFTLNERFRLNGGFIGLLEWIMGDYSQQWVAFLSRQFLETANGYEEAFEVLSTAKLLAPVYFILGGNKSGQAVVITKDRNSNKSDIWTMADTGNKWFILQTNYDHWEKPPFYDDRRTPGNKCMNNLTQENAGIEGLFNVLSTQPNLNKLTAYTALMHVSTGTLETYLQDCKHPCWPW